MALPILFYVLLQGNKFITVENAATVTNTDVVVNFGQTYRDILNAGEVGRAPPSVFNIEVTGLTTSVSTYGNGDLNLTTGDAGPGTFTTVPDEILGLFQESDVVNHISPRFLEQTETYKQWKDGSSLVIFECLLSEFIGTSSQIPSFVGNTPPPDQV